MGKWGLGIALIASLMLACQSPVREPQQDVSLANSAANKPYAIGLSYSADCPLSVSVSGDWMQLMSDLPLDSFERILFLSTPGGSISAPLTASVDRIVKDLDTARQLGFTHYPMVQIWELGISSWKPLYRGPLDNRSVQTGRSRLAPDSAFVRHYLTRLRTGQSPTFEMRTVSGCYLED